MASQRRRESGGNPSSSTRLFTPKTPQFFKIIFEEDIQDRKLEIPKKFVRKYGNNMSRQAVVEVPNGEVWSMELFKDDGDKGRMWFGNGWLKFVERYRVKPGHFVVFSYEGNSHFKVFVFDTSTTEIEYPYTGQDGDGKSLDERSRRPNIEETRSDINARKSDGTTTGTGETRAMRYEKRRRLINAQLENEKRCLELIARTCAYEKARVEESPDGGSYTPVGSQTVLEASLISKEKGILPSKQDLSLGSSVLAGATSAAETSVGKGSLTPLSTTVEQFESFKRQNYKLNDELRAAEEELKKVKENLASSDAKVEKLQTEKASLEGTVAKQRERIENIRDAVQELGGTFMNLRDGKYDDAALDNCNQTPHSRDLFAEAVERGFNKCVEQVRHVYPDLWLGFLKFGAKPEDVEVDKEKLSVVTNACLRGGGDVAREKVISAGAKQDAGTFEQASGAESISDEAECA